MGDEQVLERRRPAREQLGEVALNDRKILRMAGLNKHGCSIAGDQKGGIVAVVDFALVTLRQAVADPEDTGRDLARHPARHIGRHGSALLVAADIA